MIILFIIGLLLGAVSVVFALQNVDIITVNFFSWDLTGSLALILSTAIFAGIVIAFLLLLPGNIQSHLRYRSLRKQYGKLEEELRKQKELTVFAKDTPTDPVVISQIEQGAIEKNL